MTTSGSSKSHVFCQHCLEDWFEAKPSCPTCSQELDPRHGAGELKLASPKEFYHQLHRPSHFLNFASLEDNEISAETTERENFFE